MTAPDWCCPGCSRDMRALPGPCPCGESDPVTTPEVEQLRAEVATLAGWLLSEWVWVHETKIAEVDELLRPYLGGSDD